MRTSVVVSVTLVALLSCWMLGAANAQDAQARAYNNQGPGFTSDPLDPAVELQRIRERRILSETRRSLFPTSPLTPLRQSWLEVESRLNEATDIKFGTAFNHLFQQLSGPNLDDVTGEGDFDCCVERLEHLRLVSDQQHLGQLSPGSLCGLRREDLVHRFARLPRDSSVLVSR